MCVFLALRRVACVGVYKSGEVEAAYLQPGIF